MNTDTEAAMAAYKAAEDAQLAAWLAHEESLATYCAARAFTSAARAAFVAAGGQP